MLHRQRPVPADNPESLLDPDAIAETYVHLVNQPRSEWRWEIEVRPWENDESDIRRIDPKDGTVLERLQMPQGVFVSGIESDGADIFYAGGGGSGKVRAVRRPKRAASGVGR